MNPAGARERHDHGPWLWLRLYRLLLWAYPRDWRVEFADDSQALLIDLYAESRRSRGRAAAAWLAFRVCAEVAPSALAARRASPGSPGGRVNILKEVLADLQFAWRAVARRPRHALIVIVTLGVGVATTTAAFSLLDAAVLRRLPFPQPEQLVEVLHEIPQRQIAVNSLDGASLTAWRDRPEVFQQLEAVNVFSPVGTFDGRPDVLAGARVTPGLPAMLGARPLAGRMLSAEDAVAGAAPVALISESLWRARFGAQRDLQSIALELDDVEHAVAGVIADDFAFPSADIEVWTPFDPVADDVRARVFGRLSSGVGMERAAELAKGIAAGLAEADPRPLGWDVRLEGFETMRASDATRSNLWLAFGAAALMLAVATINVVHVVLAGALQRDREHSIRAALGARRGRLMRQVILENAIVSAIGGIAAALLAVWLVALVGWLAPQRLVRFDAVRLAVDTRALGFALLASLVAGTAAGLVPAWRSARCASAIGAHMQSRGVSTSRGQRRLTGLLVMVEACAAVVLLAGAGLLLNSFGRLVQVDVGFDADHLVAIDLPLDERRYPDAVARRQLLDDLVARIEAIPGVRAATVTDGTAGVPFGIGIRGAFESDGGSTTSGEQNIVPWGFVDPDYFDIAGISLVTGRSFLPDEAGTPTVVINESLARDLWGDDEATGRTFRATDSDTWHTVAGVVPGVAAMDLVEGLDEYQIYYPLVPGPGVAVVVLAEDDPADLIPALRESVWALDPHQPISEVRLVGESVGKWLVAPRFYLVLMAAFAVLAVGLAVVGVFGVIGHAVSSRIQEIGIRTALGAEPRSLLVLMARGGVLPALIGVALGVLIVLAGGGVMSALLYEVAPNDPATLAATVMLFVATTLLAAYLPARRALRVDPVQALVSDRA